MQDFELNKEDTQSLRKLIESIYLNGMIEDCLLIADSNIIFTNCVTDHHSLLIHAQKNIELCTNFEIGLNNLSTILKFLKMSDEVKITIDDDIIKFKNKRANIKLPLLTKDSISSAIGEYKSNPTEEILKDIADKKINVSMAEVKEMLDVLSIIEPENIIFNFSEKGVIVSGEGQHGKSSSYFLSRDNLNNEIKLGFRHKLFSNVLKTFSGNEQSCLILGKYKDVDLLVFSNDDCICAMQPLKLD
jgi:hypothetical protein